MTKQNAFVYQDSQFSKMHMTWTGTAKVHFVESLRQIK